MLEQYSYRPDPDIGCSSTDGNHAATALHRPRQNHLLAALPVEEYERLLPDLEPVSLPLGWTVHGAGDRERYLYFLTAGIVSRFYVTQDGSTTELAVTGNEGVIGVASFLGGESTLSQAVVVCAGYAYRLKADRLNEEFTREGALPDLLLRYTQALIAQTGQIAACNRFHSLKEILSRWILACLDRLQANDLAMTHEQIAHILGVRREGITEAAGTLQKAGLIHYHRGHITVRDRPQLEAQACECYAVVKREYDRLSPQENGIRGSAMHGAFRLLRTNG